MLVTSALSATPALASVAAHPGWYGPGPGPGFGWWVVFPVLWFLLFATIVFLVVRGARRGRRAGTYGPPWARGNQTAISVLGERYARGEIDEAEYRARLEVLTRQP